jgi:hypothetical protein
MANGKIFISYRREDTSGESGRLKDKLEQVFGQECIFYDVETLEAGLNFDQSIAKALSESKVLLAMIGPHWLKVTDAQGKPRIMKSQDWVRKEISLALQKNLRVIPILVNGARMPDTTDLPEDLQELSLKHAQEISSSRWNYDVGELVKVLEKIIVKKPETKPRPEPEPRPEPRPFVKPVQQEKGWFAKNYLWVLGGVVGFLLLVGMCDSGGDVTYPEENQDGSTTTEAGAGGESQTQNAGGNEIYNSLQLESQDQVPSQPSVDSPDYFDVTGQWVLKDFNGNQSILAFSQNGASFAFYEYNVLNMQIGQGSGSINGNSFSSDYYNSLVEIGGRIELTTDDNGQSWYGKVVLPAANTSSEITLTRN